MIHTGEPTLPDWIQNAYQTLETEYDAGTVELSKTEAHELLLAEAEHIEDDADAMYALDRLLERGWLYQVNGHLRKTD